MEKLPVELFATMMAHCNVEDMTNLACCNRKHYELTKPLLWKNVAIALHCEDVNDERLQNVKYTTRLKLIGPDGVVEAPVGSDEDGVLMGFNLARILAALNPEKIEVLDLMGVGKRAARHSLSILQDVRKLNIDCGRTFSRESTKEKAKIKSGFPFPGDIAQSICALRNLRSLKLTCEELKGDEGLDQVFEVNALEELHLSCNVTSSLVESISKSTNLRKLSLVTKPAFPQANENSLLNLLTALEYLETLHVLAVEGLKGDDFANLHLLTSLSSLACFRCDKDKGKLFSNIAKSTSLKELSLVPSVCMEGEGDAAVVGEIGLLNYMSNLKTISIWGSLSDSSVIIETLCLVKPWRLKVNDCSGMESPARIFILSA